MLALTINVVEGLWGHKVIAHLYETDDTGRRSCLASNTFYRPLASEDDLHDGLTSAVRTIAAWAEQTLNPER